MSKIAKKIAEHVFSSDWGNFQELYKEIDRAIEGKIISKSEVDALRKDAENMQSAQDAYNYTESLNADLRRDLAIERTLNSSHWNVNKYLCAQINSLKADLQSAVNLHILERTTPPWYLFWR